MGTATNLTTNIAVELLVVAAVITPAWPNEVDLSYQGDTSLKGLVAELFSTLESGPPPPFP